VTRSAASVREADTADLPVLVDLATRLRELSHEAGQRAGRAPSPVVVAGVAERLTACLRRPESRVIVAEMDETVVGMAVLSVSRIGQLLETPAAQLSHLVVADGYRKRGVGRALVAAAVTWAEEIGADEVVVNVYPSLREGNRFYARLGFVPLVVRRVAPTVALRRRLAQIDGRGLFEPRPRRRAIATRAGALGLRRRIGYVEDDGRGALPDVS
jgi:GNAT superfamily N-acetyltransferase